MVQGEKGSDKFKLDSSSPRARIARMMRQWIDSGRLPRGEAIPSEQTLADHFEASRATVRSVLKELEQEGLLTLINKRRVVVDRIRRAQDPIVADTVMSLADWPDNPLEKMSPGYLVYIQIGVQQELARSESACLTLDPERLTPDRIERMASNRPMGVVAFRDKAMPSVSMPQLDAIRAMSIPVVVYGYEPELRTFDTVQSDQESGTYQLTRFLIEQFGCRRIKRFWELPIDGPLYFNWLHQRDCGYERAMTEAGLAIVPPLCSKDLPFELDTHDKYQMKARYSAWVLGEALVADPEIDAIMAISDGEVCNIATACRMIGRMPGEDIHIVGYDNYYRQINERKWDAYTPPASIDKRNYEIGCELVRMLNARIEGRLGKDPCHLQVSPKLITFTT